MRQPDRKINLEEIREYVGAYKGSSDRVRHVLFLVLTVSLLMAVINYNLQTYSWPIKRTKEILEFGWEGPQARPRHLAAMKRQRLEEEKNTGSGGVEVGASVRGLATEFDVLESIRKAYIEEFLGHAILVDSPIPGLWIDVNDLGVVGGVILLLLMVALIYYLAREHENLYLSLFRVRTLCWEVGHEKGDSDANLLYHALAMTQALSSPPTLARWRRGWTEHLSIVFLLPAAVYGWVFFTNMQSMDRRPIVGDYEHEMALVLWVQALFQCSLLVLGFVAAAMSTAMAVRWHRAFYRVNPGREQKTQMSMMKWLFPKRSVSSEDSIEDMLTSQIVDTVRRWPGLAGEGGGIVEVRVDHKLSDTAMIDSEARDVVVSKLLKEAERKAKEKCVNRGRQWIGWESCQCIRNDWRTTGWIVVARFRYRWTQD